MTMRYLAIDYGTKTTGLAICDQSETFVSPLAVFSDTRDLTDKILEIIRNEKVGAVVVGLPLNMDDSKGAQAKVVEGFAEKLRKNLTIPVYFQDERLTTFAAEEKLVARELTRRGKKKRLDALAAAEILQAFLDSKQSNA